MKDQFRFRIEEDDLIVSIHGHDTILGFVDDGTEHARLDFILLHDAGNEYSFLQGLQDGLLARFNHLGSQAIFLRDAYRNGITDQDIHALLQRSLDLSFGFLFIPDDVFHEMHTKDFLDLLAAINHIVKAGNADLMDRPPIAGLEDCLHHIHDRYLDAYDRQIRNRGKQSGRAAAADDHLDCIARILFQQFPGVFQIRFHYPEKLFLFGELFRDNEFDILCQLSKRSHNQDWCLHKIPPKTGTRPKRPVPVSLQFIKFIIQSPML